MDKGQWLDSFVLECRRYTLDDEAALRARAGELWLLFPDLPPAVVARSEYSAEMTDEKALLQRVRDEGRQARAAGARREDNPVLLEVMTNGRRRLPFDVWTMRIDAWNTGWDEGERRSPR